LQDELRFAEPFKAVKPPLVSDLFGFDKALEFISGPAISA